MGSRLTKQSWGRIPYREAHRRQTELVDQRRRDEVEDLLILCEHESVITAGRGFRDPLPADLPFPAVEVERGGLLTYHGPGQIVGYPIVLLEGENKDIHRFIESVERGVIYGLENLGLEAEGKGGGGLRGVWVGNQKIASIGIAVRRWVTYHGFALNVTTDLKAFQGFDPCGLDPDVMTNLAHEMGQAPDWERVEDALFDGFLRAFDAQVGR